MRPLVCLTLFAASMQGAQALSLPGLDGGRTHYLPLIIREATAQGIPPELADAVAMVETGYRPDAVGSSGEIGLMQVMPATARQLGFYGTTIELADPATNIALGVRYLARAWMLGGGDICRSLMKYRAGLGQETMTPLSAGYCTRAIAWLGSTGSSLARGATIPDGSVASPALSADPYVIAIAPALAAQARFRQDQITQRLPAPAREQRRILPGLALNEAQSSRQRVLPGHRAGLSEHVVSNVQAAIQSSLAETNP